MPHRDFELPPAEVREGLTPATASGAAFGTAFGAPTGAAATGAAADSYYATLGRLCTRDTSFAQPVKLAGARGFFGGGGGQLELVWSPPQVEKGTRGARSACKNLHVVKSACASLLASPVAALGPVSRPKPGALHEPHVSHPVRAGARPPAAAMPWPRIRAASPFARRGERCALCADVQGASHLQEDGVRGGRRGCGGASIRHHGSRMSACRERTGV